MSPAEFIKPYLWLAALAFVVGFLSYFALGRPVEAQVSKAPMRAAISAPVSDEWNVPKHI